MVPLESSCRGVLRVSSSFSAWEISGMLSLEKSLGSPTTSIPHAFSKLVGTPTDSVDWLCKRIHESRGDILFALVPALES
jgi:hypothetical protein